MIKTLGIAIPEITGLESVPPHRLQGKLLVLVVPLQGGWRADDKLSRCTVRAVTLLRVDDPCRHSGRGFADRAERRRRGIVCEPAEDGPYFTESIVVVDRLSEFLCESLSQFARQRRTSADQ